MTYKLVLEDQDTSTNLCDSSVYSIVDGDELQIEPVNVATDKPKSLLAMLEKPIDDNNSTISMIINNVTSKIAINKPHEELNNDQDINVNNVCIDILFYIVNLYLC